MTPVRSIREIQEATRGARRGTIRGGEEKDGKPVRRETWLLTSPDRAVLEAITFGGPITEFASDRSNDRFARDTETNELRVLLSAYGDPLSQRYELYGSGGLIRNCDGETCATVDQKTGEMIEQGCLCSEESRECKLATRLAVVLVDAVTFGSWLLTTGSENAAYELRFAVNMLMGAAARGANVPAVLRLEQRTVKKQGEKFPRRFCVPVLDADPLAVRALEAGGNGEAPVALETGEVREIAAPAAAPEPPPKVKLVTRPQIVRMFAVASDSKVPEETVKQIIANVAGVESSKEIPAAVYDAVIDAIAQEALDLDAPHTEEAPEEEPVSGQVVMGAEPGEPLPSEMIAKRRRAPGDA